MTPILVEPLSEQAYELLRQLEALHILRVVRQDEVPVIKPRKWTGALAGISPVAATAWDQHLQDSRNEWERDI